MPKRLGITGLIYTKHVCFIFAQNHSYIKKEFNKLIGQQAGGCCPGFWCGLTDTSASVTLVSTAGRKEWTRILCSVTANTSKVTAFSGPRLWSRVENLPPLRKTNIKILFYFWSQQEN